VRKKTRKRRSQAEVELNLAAMLDMAFQLLAFFILTFRQPPLEGQIALRLPPPQTTVVAKNGQAAGADADNKNPLQGMNTLTISVSADPKSGEINGLSVGEGHVTGLAALDGRLKELLRDPGNPFDQVIIQVSDSCRYEELMKILDICTHQTFADGKKLSKLSFVELPGGG
jgi:biopolymer transport protein ExbD